MHLVWNRAFRNRWLYHYDLINNHLKWIFQILTFYMQLEYLRRKKKGIEYFEMMKVWAHSSYFKTSSHNFLCADPFFTVLLAKNCFTGSTYPHSLWLEVGMGGKAMCNHRNISAGLSSYSPMLHVLRHVEQSNDRGESFIKSWGDCEHVIE